MDSEKIDDSRRIPFVEISKVPRVWNPNRLSFFDVASHAKKYQTWRFLKEGEGRGKHSGISLANPTPYIERVDNTNKITEHEEIRLIIDHPDFTNYILEANCHSRRGFTLRQIAHLGVYIFNFACSFPEAFSFEDSHHFVAKYEGKDAPEVKNIPNEEYELYQVSQGENGMFYLEIECQC